MSSALRNIEPVSSGAPLRRIRECVRQEYPEIGFESFTVGDIFLDSTCQCGGATQAVKGHAVDGLANGRRITVRAEPVLALHAPGKIEGTFGQCSGVLRHGQENLLRESLQGGYGVVGPVAGEQMVVKKVDKDAANPPAYCTDPGAAGAKGRMQVGKTVDGPVQGQARGQFGW